MLSLWLSIICSTGIYLLFKIRGKLGANLRGIIVINYLLATILGFIISPQNITVQLLLQAKWLPLAALIGLLFVMMFFLIGRSTEKAGISTTSIATRMSMIFPILFSMLLFEEIITISKIIKITLTLTAVFLSIYQKPKKEDKISFSFLPLILFIGSGGVDTLVKTAQNNYIPENEIQLFSSSLFGISLLASLLLLLFKNDRNKILSKNTILLGATLGAFNFGSLYFLINALTKSGYDSSLVFGINNLAIVCLSLLLGFFIFREKISRINWIGISLSIISIILLIQI
jgi:drug/metabolite transporter (DMT)-like permease